jgi:hypothetical protein
MFLTDTKLTESRFVTAPKVRYCRYSRLYRSELPYPFIGRFYCRSKLESPVKKLMIICLRVCRQLVIKIALTSGIPIFRERYERYDRYYVCTGRKTEILSLKKIENLQN